MRKKLISLALAFALVLSLIPAASAAGFADVTDTATARNVEVLRLMGVIEGDDNALFRPDSSLTRAEFCKMAVVLKGMRSVTARYGSRTVFPDVRASHWAAGYVNYAAGKDVGLIHGMPDGTFQPDRAITYGEAVTILTRQLGYTDADTGGIWPDGYIALAGEVGMTKGVPASGSAAITRAQAARLFVNALTSENEKGQTLLAVLGYTVNLTADPVTLYSVDMANGKLRTSDAKTPNIAMETPMPSTVLNGLKGYVVKKGDKAVTFLPSASTAGSAVSDAAVIVSADGSAAGFDALTGGATGYTVYRNGNRASVADLRRNDVVTYVAANNTIQACDTRIGVYYEKCSPSPGAPLTVTVLGGTEFPVLPTAQQSVAKFKPGEKMILLLTADGEVAGAVAGGAYDMQGNAIAAVDGDGKVKLLCSGTLIALNCPGKGHEEEIVRVSQNGIMRLSDSGAVRDGIYLSAQRNNLTEKVDLANMMLGKKKIAENALLFDRGEPVTVDELREQGFVTISTVYARTNHAGEVDVLGLRSASKEYYGRVVPGSTHAYEVDCGGTKTWPAWSLTQLRVGDFVAVSINDAGDEAAVTGLVVLTKIENVPEASWLDKTTVVADGQTYTVPSGVLCYNHDSGTWFEGLDAALAYGGTIDLYVKDGVVRIVGVRS